MMKEITLHIEKLYKNDLPMEACQVAVAFPKGELPAENLSRLVLTEDGSALPLQLLPTSEWGDGSIRYLLIRFQADIPGNKGKTLILRERNAAEAAEDISSPLQIRKTGDGFFVDNGPLSFSLSDGADSVFSSVSLQRSEEAPPLTFTGAQLRGPVLKCGGKEASLHIDRWTMAESGPVLAIFEGEGHYDQPYRTRCNVRLTVTAGKPWADLGVRLFNDSETALEPDSWIFYVKSSADSMLTDALPEAATEVIDSTGCGDMNRTCREEGILHTTGTGELAAHEASFRESAPMGTRTAIGISNYKTRFTLAGNGETLSKEIHAPFLIGEANEHFAEVLYGTFFADYCTPEGGVCATVYQAQQNYPKAVKAEGNGLAAYLIPEGTEKVHFAPGMAREQRILLHFHGPQTTLEALDDRSLIYQMPVQPFIDPSVYDRAGVFPPIVTPPELLDPEVERVLADKADHHGRAYGMMNWGDFPDSNYTAQGRGNGRLVWTNNEYDYPHAMFLMYARTGVRRFLDYAVTAARHWMDVDVCHYHQDPLRIGGQWEHTAGHVGLPLSEGGPEGVMVCSHEWVEGLLDYWHFSGDRRARDTAIGIGENVLRLLETPMYQKPGEASARETGWALRTLSALYTETREERWLHKCHRIIRQFEEWNDKYGAWLAPYTDNTVIRVGFMISVAIGSLMRYYRLFPEENLKILILSAIDDLTENFRNPYGLFYYKELPSLQRNGNNTLLLEAMFIGYELTGDTKYLECGLPTFRLSIRDVDANGGGKRIVEDAVLVGSTPTKSFAQGFLPLVQFYNALVREGML